MGMTCAWRPSSNANEVSDPAVMTGAHPAHDDDLLRPFEAAVLAAIFDQPRGESGPDAGNPHELFHRSRVDVDAIFLGERRGIHQKKQQKKGKKHESDDLCFL